MTRDIHLSESDIARFWSKVHRRGADECWEWQGADDGHGYGHLWLGGSTVRATHVAWVIAHGQIPDGMHILHQCDNPPCCNAAHLFLGTPLHNARDRESKMRGNQPRGQANGRHTMPERTSRGEKHSEVMKRVAARGERSGSRTHPESRPRKLTDAQCDEIRAFRRQGIPQTIVAIKYGISRSMVSMIEHDKRRAS